ncbi:MAG: hypothetical protein GY704_03025, partial [Phycisphaeraceae bacterium]|nr:hypothetical protein [Phycisphaeraceae bacterium]
MTSRTGGVYMSPAAEEWRRFLLAVERPERADIVRMAATSLLFGLHPEEVAGLSDTDVLELKHRFNAWQTLLRRHGVPALVADLHHRRGLAARVLSEVDGERLMTDLGHIAQEMHAVYRRGRTGSLAGWIEAAMAESTQMEADRAEEPESRQRRLETDADAVPVQTIHGAKGLEYPVVFVPFAWDRSPRRPAIPVFHDPQAVADDTPRPRLIDVGGPDGDDFGANQALAMAEDEAEEGRLLYVALTRAKHRLHVWWLEDADNVDDAKLTELIRRDGRGIDDLLAAAGDAIGAIVHEDFAVLASYEPPEGDSVTLDRARFDRPLDHAWQRSSFTSLSTEHPLTNADTTDGPLRADEE